MGLLAKSKWIPELWVDNIGIQSIQLVGLTSDIGTWVSALAGPALYFPRSSERWQSCKKKLSLEGSVRYSRVGPIKVPLSEEQEGEILLGWISLSQGSVPYRLGYSRISFVMSTRR
jgi:hypothetical protein